MTRHVLLIHGTWCNGSHWSEFASELTGRGYTVHAPTLRHHGDSGTSDVWGNAQRVAGVGLLDHVSDLQELVQAMDAPPIIVGHSLGGLIAQLLAARVPSAGVVLLAPAPPAGMWATYPSILRVWGRYVPQWLASKPMYPMSYKDWQKYVCNETPASASEAYYASLCAESGTTYREMVMWYLDPKRAAKVDFDAITSPVLVITGSQDKATAPQWGRKIAGKLGERGRHVNLVGSDHMMTVGRYLPQALEAIDQWTHANALRPYEPAAS